MNVYVKGGIAALIVAAGLFGWYRLKEDSLPVNQSPIGFQLIKQMETEGVPEITLQRLDGSTLKLSDLRGKIVVVNFWASWCNPCVEEFPSLVKLIGQFKNDVVVLAVSEDETREDMTAFMKAMKLPQPGIEIVWDPTKDAMKAYGVEKIPETFLVGRDGKLIRKVLGIENWANDDAIQYFTHLVTSTKPVAPEAIAPAPVSTPEEAALEDGPVTQTPKDGAINGAKDPAKDSKKKAKKANKSSKKKPAKKTKTNKTSD